MPKVLDAIAGGWQLTWNGFAKSGTGFTPFWTCGNCGPVYPGNVASDSLALARGEQQERPGWAARLREAMAAKKAQQKS